MLVGVISINLFINFLKMVVGVIHSCLRQRRIKKLREKNRIVRIMPLLVEVASLTPVIANEI